MSGEMHANARAPDKAKGHGISATTVAPSSLPFPPCTPPMLDPTSFRPPRLTPNIREMLTSFAHLPQDPNAAINELLASPDPSGLYSSLQMTSPMLRDFYPTHSPVTASVPDYDGQSCPSNPESHSERMARMAGGHAEMNALFTGISQSTSDTENVSDSNNERVISLMSSPDIGSDPTTINADSRSTDQSKSKPFVSNQPTRRSPRSSQTSSETPPPHDTSTASPSTSPELTTTPNDTPKLPTRAARPAKREPAPCSSAKTTDKPKRLSSKPPPPPRPRAPTSAQSQFNSTAAAMAAANAAVMNPAMAGLMPFACMPPGMAPGMPPHMMASAGAMHYQGRPMAFVAGAHGPELIPVEALAQATAFHYGAAQAAQAVSRMMHPMVGSNATPSQTTSPLEPVGGSRKKRRRQLLERSGCSEEESRENRARALKRLRHKKTLRSQNATVRYACRKRIAMVRPRVNGRFATKEEVEDVHRP